MKEKGEQEKEKAEKETFALGDWGEERGWEEKTVEVNPSCEHSFSTEQRKTKCSPGQVNCPGHPPT